jgi:predicted MFS family arabinose efflux permease
LVSSALRLSPPEKRARTAATIVGAIGIGLFTVRTLLGSLADLVGWRAAVLIVAAIVLGLLPVSWKYSPPSAPANPPKYLTILASIPAIARRSAALRRMAAIHTLVFAAFIAIWSMSALHAVDDLGITVTEGSLLGVAGILAGTTTMIWVGRQTRLSQRTLLVLTLVAATLSSLVVIVAPNELWLLIPALFLVSFAMSSEQVVTQARALASVSGEESGRANTVYMASTFVGSTLATAIAAVLYTQIGYFAIGIFALVCAALAIAVALGANRQKMFAA